MDNLEFFDKSFLYHVQKSFCLVFEGVFICAHTAGMGLHRYGQNFVVIWGWLINPQGTQCQDGTDTATPMCPT